MRETHPTHLSAHKLSIPPYLGTFGHLWLATSSEYTGDFDGNEFLISPFSASFDLFRLLFVEARQREKYIC